MKIGVLALQGDFEAHARVLARLSVPASEVRTPVQLADVDALIIPGGESTTLRIIANAVGLLEPLRERARAGMPILGTCAGMIVCAAEIADGDEPIIGHVPIRVRRNAYGRQNESFEADVSVDGIGEVRAVFIRAPRIEAVGDGVGVIARLDGDPIAIRFGATLLLAFHPEIAGDDRLHADWLSRI